MAPQTQKFISLDLKQWMVDRACATCFACVLNTCALLLSFSSQAFSADTEEDRVSWVLKVESKECAYVHQMDKKWLFSRPNVKLSAMSEVSRTDKEIVLQDTKSKLFIRLTADWAYWRKPSQEMWTKYRQGAWREPPQDVLDWIKEKQAVMAPSSKNAPAKSVADVERTAWVCEIESKECAYVREIGKTWLFSRPNVKLDELSEVSRTDEEIVLQGKKSKLFIRLTAERAYWRKSSQDTWTTYVRGSWREPPKVVVDWIREKQALMGAPAKPVPSAVTEIAEKHDYRVRVIYFVPSDRDPVANWERKLHVIMQFANSMFHSDLTAKGMKTSGLLYEMDNGLLRPHLVRGVRPAMYYNNAPAFDRLEQNKRVKEEVYDNGFGDGTLRIVFCENYDYGPSEYGWNGTIALGGYKSATSGMAVYSAHLLRDEFCALTVQDQRQKFFDQTPVLGRRVRGHRMNSPRCEFVEDGFGAVIHELGHALGLPHDEQEGRLTIMGNGFRKMRQNLSVQTPRSQMVTFSDVNTHLLMSSRFLNPQLDRNDQTPPKARLEILDVSGRSGLVRLRVTASDESGLRVFGIHDKNANDGDFIEGAPLDSLELNKELTVKAKPEDGKISVELIVADNGGNQSRRRKNWPE